MIEMPRQLHDFSAPQVFVADNGGASGVNSKNGNNYPLRSVEGNPLILGMLLDNSAL